MKGGKNRMRGFMCQPNASTAVCIPGDPHSVIVPRRPDRTLVDHAKIADLRYDRLIDRPTIADLRHDRLKIVDLRHSRPVDCPKLPPPAAAPPSKAEKIIKMIVSEKEGTADVAPSPPSDPDPVFQVVVMRVSLHCQGCAGKVKKHIAKMEGVTSFNVDLEAKRVTVKGHVSPTMVLESVSKVKKAEFWPNNAVAK